MSRIRQNGVPNDAESVAASARSGGLSIASFFTASSAHSGATGTRDRRIMQLQDEIDRLRKDVERERCQRRKDTAVHDMEMKKLRGQKIAAEKRNEILMRDMDDKHAISHYASLIKKASPGQVDSSYVIKLQAQLAKAMHRMGVLENQVVLAEQACEGVVTNLEKEVEKVIERTSNLEVERAQKVDRYKAEVKRYKEELSKVKDATSKAEVEYLSQVVKLEDENRALREQIASKGGTSDCDDRPSDSFYSRQTAQNDRAADDGSGRHSGGDQDQVWGVDIIGGNYDSAVDDGSSRRSSRRDRDQAWGMDIQVGEREQDVARANGHGERDSASRKGKSPREGSGRDRNRRESRKSRSSAVKR